MTPWWKRLISNTYLFASIILVVGIGIGFCIRSAFEQKILDPECSDGLTFIEPSLDCGAGDSSKADILSGLHDKIRVLIDGYTKGAQANRISVFVRDLNTKRFFGINDSDQYYMASLLKVPVAIAGYKLAEVEPLILKQSIKFTGNYNLNNEQTMKPEEVLQVGKSYTVEDLIRRALVYSDNNAAQLLFDFYPKNFMDRIMSALNLQMTAPAGIRENLTSARSFSAVFRTLYNTSYLTREYSDKVLDLLSQSTFKDGAVAQLPGDLTVSHKFAERTIEDQYGQPKQLHDCGIVYAGKGDEPYVYCIMTEGKNFSDLEKVQQDISLVIYNSMLSIDSSD